jgi:succinoglycan biosynthesis protein ExoM
MLRRLLSFLAEASWATGLRAETIIVVVDNAPGGLSAAVCDSFRSALPAELVYIEEPIRGIPNSRNRAVRVGLESGADAIAFIDDDDMPQEDWLQKLLGTQAESQAGLVFGSWTLPSSLVIPECFSGLPLFRPPAERHIGRFGLPNWVGTGNVLILRDAFDSLKDDKHIFDPSLADAGGEDLDFFIRAVRSGVRFSAAEDSIVILGFTQDDLRIRGTLRQAKRAGFVSVLIAQRHLPEEEFRQIPTRRKAGYARAWRNLILAPFCGKPRRKAIVGALYQLSRAAGELMACRGKTMRYYA